MERFIECEGEVKQASKIRRRVTALAAEAMHGPSRSRSTDLLDPDGRTEVPSGQSSSGSIDLPDPDRAASGACSLPRAPGP